MKVIKKQPLTEAPQKKKLMITGLRNSSDDFLRYLDRIGLFIGETVEVAEVEDFDRSLKILHKKKSLTLSHEAADNLLVNMP